MDQGFFSQKNIKELIEHKIDFIIPLLKSTKLFAEHCEEHNNKLQNAKNVVVVNNHSYYSMSKEVNYKGDNLHSKIYEDINKKGIDLNHYYSDLELFEKTLNNSHFEGKDVEELILPYLKKYKKYFNISIKNSTVNVERNYDNINKYLEKIGRIVLLSKDEKDNKSVIEYYREKDLVEKDFDNLKNYVEGVPLRIQTEKSLNGVLFVNFLSVIIRREILNILKPLRTDKFFQKMSVNEIFIELSKLKQIKLNSQKYLSEITKTQKKIFEAFNIKIPS